MSTIKRLSVLALAALLPIAAVAGDAFSTSGAPIGAETNTGASLASCPAGTDSFALTSVFRYCVNPNGTLASIDEFGTNAIGQESYGMCSDQTGSLSLTARPDSQSVGFGTPTRSQPGGPNTLPLSITVNSNDLRLQVTQSFINDLGNRRIILRTQVKNTSGVPITNLRVYRAVDADAGGLTKNFFGRTGYSTFAWIDTVGNPPDTRNNRMLVLNSNSTSYPASTFITPFSNAAGINFFTTCGVPNSTNEGYQTGKIPSENGVMKVYNTIGTLQADAVALYDTIYETK